MTLILKEMMMMKLNNDTDDKDKKMQLIVLKD